MRAELGAPLELGQTLWGRRRVIPIAGGEFDGPRLRGIVLAGGADWQVVHPDGHGHDRHRYTLQTHDGALISAPARTMTGSTASSPGPPRSGSPVPSSTTRMR